MANGGNIDPQQLAAAIRLGALYVEAGARKFAQFASTLYTATGNDDIKPHLPRIYTAVYNRPEMKKHRKQMGQAEVG